ncbi:hypothetical protein TNCV_1643391 [Trichonephila clavipes]|nr:hypothetical protein TNCV_1643391 [Trichonephila clavipes]
MKKFNFSCPATSKRTSVSCLPSVIVVSELCGFIAFIAFVAGGTLNSHRVASPLVKLVEGEEKWKVPDHLQSVLPQNWGGTEQNCTLPSAVHKG